MKGLNVAELTYEEFEKNLHDKLWAQGFRKETPSKVFDTMLKKALEQMFHDKSGNFQKAFTQLNDLFQDELRNQLKPFGIVKPSNRVKEQMGENNTLGKTAGEGLKGHPNRKGDGMAEPNYADWIYKGLRGEILADKSDKTDKYRIRLAYNLAMSKPTNKYKESLENDLRSRPLPRPAGP